MMDYEKILSQLRSLKMETHSMACFGCGKEHNCGVRGCAVIRAGIDAIEELLIEQENYRRQLGDTRRELQGSEEARSDLAKQLAATQQKLDTLVRRDTGKVPHHESLADCNCPVCGCGISWDGLNDPLDYAPKFCDECGQRFDWSEEKERGRGEGL